MGKIAAINDTARRARSNSRNVICMAWECAMAPLMLCLSDSLPTLCAFLRSSSIHTATLNCKHSADFRSRLRLLAEVCAPFSKAAMLANSRNARESWHPQRLPLQPLPPFDPASCSQPGAIQRTRCVSLKSFSGYNFSPCSCLHHVALLHSCAPVASTPRPTVLSRASCGVPPAPS